MPCLNLKGISSSDFSEALATLLGQDARGFSAGAISRLRQGWRQEYDDWRTRGLGREERVYIWADGIYFKICGDEARQCIQQNLTSFPQT